MKTFGAREIEKSFVNRYRFDKGRELQHHVAHLAAYRRIFRHVGLDDDRIGTQRQRLEHWHGRANAANASDVAGRRNDAAPAAAYDDRSVRQFGVVPLFHSGIERIAIDMSG
jgi:hypothetical protein